MQMYLFAMNQNACVVLTLTLLCNVFSEEFISRPKIISEDGNLIILASFNRNITLKTFGSKSYINIHDGNEVRLLSAAAISTQNYKETSHVIQDDRVTDIVASINGPRGIMKRLSSLEFKTLNGFRSWSYMPPLSRIQSNLQGEIEMIKYLLMKDDCVSSPCKNGGECQDLYDGFKCRCTPNWTGRNCDEDVDECRRLTGTSIGCQNGATCINKPGSYQCQCSPGWYGLHCIRRDLNCSGHDSEMCGHGMCSLYNPGPGIKCFCDQGWTTDEVHRACVVDVDECNEKKNACSVDPPVKCVNLQGSYTCENCPMGYEGDGYTCSDVDECQINNGGCSKIPYVQCMNTVGSRKCGPCPSDYQGNGLSCVPIKIQDSNNRPLGQCQSGTCGVHGKCDITPEGYMCICQDGYEGSDCSKFKDACKDVPCKNGGVCIKSNSTRSGYRCECGDQYTGAQCQERARACADHHDTEGHIDYPMSNSSSYLHNAECTWFIQTSSDKVLNVTFTRFNLENSTDCDKDWLEIHDGRSSSSHKIGRFCGDSLPKGGSIISTHNTLYFWFRSDHSVVGNGFSLDWKSIDYDCSAEVDVSSHGSIKSPGFPGPYPPNRDCYWTLTAKPGKRILLRFLPLEPEAHDNCSSDYIEITNGMPSDPVLQKYCASNEPPPFTSHGSSLWIHFHSDARKNAGGFQISYTVTEGIPGCGGKYTTETGELTPPPGDHFDLYCEYHIQVFIGSLIKIDYLELDLGYYHDYLSVYDGGSTESKLVGQYTGRRPPASYTSSSNEMFLLLETDQSGRSVSFRIKYETICYKSFTEEQGVISFSAYSKTHLKSAKYHERCKYLVQVSQGKSLELRFINSLINKNDNCVHGSSHDYNTLTIYDGDSAKSPKLGTYCNSTDTHSEIISTHNYIYMEYDTYYPHDGTFSIKYNSIDALCGGHFKDHSGNITFPASPSLENPNNYFNVGYDYDEDDDGFRNCSWIISAPIGYVIHLTWISIDVKLTDSCRLVSVKLYDKDSETGDQQLMGKYCGNRLPPAVTSTSNQIIVAYDVTYDNIYRYEKFKLLYYFLNTRSFCNGNLQTSHGVLKSPGWPYFYPSNKDCEWTITLPLGQQILLNFIHFNLQDDSSCIKDWLEIRDGIHKRSPVLGKYCGLTIPKPITSSGNALRIHFKSDYYLESRGFVIEWHEIVTRCGGSLNGSEGSLTSPNYPDAYGKDSECIWRITTNAGSAIEICFTDLDLDEDTNCEHHYIEFYDGSDNSAGRIGRFCSIKSIPKIISSSNNIYIKYRSDIDMERKGFALDYKALCNRTISGFSGVIESPDFPNNYRELINCTWNIIVPQGSIIVVTFIDFDVETPENNYHIRYFTFCSDSYLTLRDGLNTNHVKSCGKRLPEEFTTTSNELEINFATNASYGRFRLEWIANGCGGKLRQPEGEFSPTLFEEEENSEMVCHWQIIGNPGTSIELTVSDIHMDADLNCEGQYIVLFNGPTEDSPVLSKMCHREKESTVTSSSNYMYVIFKAKSFTNHAFKSNFTAKYRQITSRCGGKFSSYHGNITSPNYPNNYGKNLNCFWTIEVDKNHLIELNFIDFDVVDNKGICSDFVKIYEGVDPAEEGMNVTKYCGSKNPFSLNFISKTNRITVQLKTDDKNIKAKGFKFNYHTTCGARITTDSEGFLNSDSALKTARNNNCTWTILSKDLNQQVYVTFTQMNLHLAPGVKDCKHTYLNVFNGDDVDAPLMGTYCGGKAPRAIVSTGSAITIQLGSGDGHIYGRFSAHYSVLATACGGVLSSESGSLTSPKYPYTYPFSSDCVWTLNTSPGNKLSISFEKLDIESSENCTEDYIEIRENGEAGRVLRVLCGSEKPEEEIEGTQVYINFHSDDKGTAAGFILHFSYLRINEITGLTGGQISSPLYPQMITSNEEYSWRVSTKLETLIDITIQDIDIGVSMDYCDSYLAIYDGFREDAPLLFKDCGNAIPTTLRSTYNTLYIKLRLMSFKESRFLLEWREISIDKTTPEDNKDTICNSNNVIHIDKGSSFRLTSPGYPDKYDNNIKCEWIFSTVPGNHLSIIFSEIDLNQSEDCYVDRINVFERSDGKWKALSDNICFLNNTKTQKVEGNSKMKVIFVSLENELMKQGFSAAVTSECGGHLISDSAVIKPSIHDTDCIWTVRVRPQRTIEVDVHFFNAYSKRCEQYVILRDGGMADSPLLGKNKYCSGKDFDSEKIITTSNWLYVKFFSQYAYYSAAFQMRYFEISQECGFKKILTDEMNFTTISSPNYPNSPPPFVECIWVITAPAGEILQLDVVDRFDLTRGSACSKERLEIRDGGTKKSELIGVYCRDTPSTQKTTGNMIFVRFITNIDEPKNGFKAKISIGMCGGTIRGKGSFTSPGYPSLSNLPPGTLCKWRLIGLPHQGLVINFVDFQLPPSEDLCGTNLTVYEILPWEKIPELLSGPLCNNSHIPASITSMSNEVEVRFQIGISPHSVPLHDNTHTGFSISFISNRIICDYTMNEPSDYIRSIIYPNLSKRPQDCQWEIKVPSGRRVTLELLDDLDLHDPDNYLRIYDAGSEHQLAIRAEERPIIVKSSNNQMFIRYIGNGGFKAKYTSDEPTVCLGSLSQSNGTINLPAEDHFYCVWTRTVSEDKFISNTTILLTFSNLTMTGFDSLHEDCPISIKYDDTFSKDICGPYASGEVKIRNPDVEISLIVQRTTASSLFFVLDYTLQPCGGVMEAKEGSSWIRLPKEHTGSLDCAWYFKNPDGLGINITIEGGLYSNCDKEYFKISDLDYNQAKIRKYCKNEMPSYNLKLQLRNILVEYHTDSFSDKSNLTMELYTERKGCGGELKNQYSKSFESPNYPNSYGSNEECIWDIEVNIGYRIRLKFDSFNVQETNNCSKDFVQVYDFANDKYIANPKLCGRNLPEQVDSTVNKMRVIFRSDDSVFRKGFQASWTTHCGGSYQATEEEQWLHSPMRFWQHEDFDECIYQISVINKYIRINFIQFHLTGRDKIDCTDHKLTLVDVGYLKHRRTYCGNDFPPTQIFKDGVTITFSKFISYRDFEYNFTFAIDQCDEEITKPGVYSSPRNEEATYYGGLVCHWNITAPDDKIIILHFLNIDINCEDEYLAVYEGVALDYKHPLAYLCRSSDNSSPLYRQYISKKNKMSIEFATRRKRVAGLVGFNLEIVFMYNEKSGCGGNKELQVNGSIQIMSLPVRNQDQYVPFLDCHTIVEATADQVLSVSFQKIQIAPCDFNITTTNSTCNCDYVELHDGNTLNDEVLARYCSRTSSLPPLVVTSTKYLYVRFVSDATLEDRGYEATVTAMYTKCGKRNFQSAEALQRIVAPRDENGAILRGLNCKYQIQVNRYQRMRIHFKTIDLEPPSTADNLCHGDLIRIKNVFGNYEEDPYYPERLERSSTVTPGHIYTTCGTMKNFTLDITKKMYLHVKTSSHILSRHYSGYEMEISTAETCDMIYKDPQNRITLKETLFKTCTFLIEAPENYTISLYFSSWSGIDSSIEVSDGNTTESSNNSFLRNDLDSDENLDAVFSTGRYMTIRINNTNLYGMHLDMYYVTTNKGRGCGGQLYSNNGVFTSPMYPRPYRKQAVCEWIVETPPGTHLKLQFPKFDLGHRQLCDQNDLKLINRAGQLLATYCSDDQTADHTSEDNYMKVIFRISVNGDGPGWKAQFSASHIGYGN